jgi:hypothetical protein
MIHRIRRALQSRLADASYEILVRTERSGVGSERRVGVVQKAHVAEDPAVIAEPALLKVPQALVALAGEHDDEPLNDGENLCEVLPDVRDDKVWYRKDDSERDC